MISTSEIKISVVVDENTSSWACVPCTRRLNWLKKARPEHGFAFCCGEDVARIAAP